VIHQGGVTTSSISFSVARPAAFRAFTLKIYFRRQVKIIGPFSLRRQNASYYRNSPAYRQPGICMFTAEIDIGEFKRKSILIMVQLDLWFALKVPEELHRRRAVRAYC
jgi:hypothetical protein